MASKEEFRDLIDDLFEEEALVLGGLVAIHEVDDDLVWQLARSLDAIRRKALARLNQTEHVGGDDPSRPVWYKCLLPVIATEFVKSFTLNPPLGPFNPARSVEFHLQINGETEVGLSWVLDERADEVPDSRIIGDDYQVSWQDWGLPDPEDFHLGPLPPIVSPANQPADTSDTATPDPPAPSP